MKRARLVLLLPVLLPIANGMLTSPARADCANEIQALRIQLASVKDEHRREELQKLIDKAEKDAEAGRNQLCGEAMQRARVLIKG